MADLEKLIDQASRMMAAGWRGNPNMSGDDRDFMPPSQRRRHDDRVRSVVEFVLSESAKQKGEAEGWRDIESAPKDGAPFFGIGSDDAYPQPMRWQAYSDEEPEEIGETGYWAYCEDLIGDVTGSATPTHWRPMFAPPSAMLSAGGEG